MSKTPLTSKFSIIDGSKYANEPKRKRVVKPKIPVYRKRDGYGTRKRYMADYTTQPLPKVTSDGWLAPALGTAGGLVGGFIGGPAGAAIGSSLGYSAGTTFKYYTGLGDYKIRSNVLMTPNADITPIVNRNSHGGVVIRRCEYIADVISSTSANTFLNTSYPVNPGLEPTFLWLSQIAANFEEYAIEGMYFEYRTMSADALNSTNTALGQVIMAANYNSGSPNFNNKQEMENYQGGISCKPSDSMRYFVECAKLQSVLNDLYVRPGAVPAGQDIRLYDLCNFQIATNGLQGTSVNCGELWVCYQIALLKPKLFSALGAFNSFYNAILTAPGYSNAKPITAASTYNLNGANNLAVVIQDNEIVFPESSIPQQYYVMLQWIGSGASALTIPTLTGGAGATVVVQNTGPNTGEIGSRVVLWAFVNTAANTQNGANITVNAGVLPTTPQSLQIIIEQVPRF